MALSRITIQSALQGTLLGALNGSNAANTLADAVASALSSWIRSTGSVVVTGVASGFSGGGAVSGGFDRPLLQAWQAKSENSSCSSRRFSGGQGDHGAGVRIGGGADG